MTAPSGYAAEIGRALAAAAAGLGLPDGGAAVEPSRREEHGDYSTNLAMQAARAAKRNPREVAADVIARLERPDFVESVEIAGPGFVNFTLTESARAAILGQILSERDDYGRGEKKPGKILLEFVSANPTGPLHIGHGRQAAHGSSLAEILRFDGHETDTEYLINDTGRQMRTLAVSLWLRYLQEGGRRDIAIPKGAYEGDYMILLARRLREEHGARFEPEGASPEPEAEDGEDPVDAWLYCALSLLRGDFDVVSDFAKNAMLEDIRRDLDDFGVSFSNWVSEWDIRAGGRVLEALAIVDKAGLLYEADGARWFRSTAHGDDKDRVVRRSDGDETYFSSDFGYHLDKFLRGYDRLILEAGQDHHGYLPRMRAMVAGLGRDPDAFEMKLFAMVRMVRSENVAKLSTRSGRFVSLRELVDAVGRDAARFTYLTRRSNQALDFDLQLAASRSADNPVYYVQYAHARICSVMRQWAGDPAELAGAPADGLAHPGEIALMRRLFGFPEAVRLAAREREPHHVAFYLRDLAAAFHGYYNEVPFLDAEPALRLARLKLIEAARIVIANALSLLGVSAPERMEGHKEDAEDK